MDVAKLAEQEDPELTSFMAQQNNNYFQIDLKTRRKDFS